MSDPAIKAMNDTQWLFELEGLALKTERKYDDIASFTKLTRQGLVDLLGLNVMPVPEEIPLEEGGGLDEEGKPITRLRRSSDGEIVPLAMLIADPEVINEIAKQNQELATQNMLDEKEEAGEIVHRTPEELDEYMDSDIEFIDDPDMFRKKMIWESPETKATLESMVKPLLKEEPEEVAKPVLERPKRRSRVVIT